VDKVSGFNDLRFERLGSIWFRAVEEFPNGYGVSVITYGRYGERELYDVDVLRGEHICYTTPDLDAGGVSDLMARVQALPYVPQRCERRGGEMIVESLRFPRTEGLALSADENGVNIMMTRDTVRGTEVLLWIEWERLPKVIAYMTRCLSEWQEKE